MISGFYNVLKPTGFTSSDVVCKLKSILSMSFRYPVKIGHLGTLDPGGSGVLVVAVGNATKTFDVVRNHRKTYRAEAVFGVTTDTLDSYGKITEKAVWYDNEQDLTDSFYDEFYKNLDSVIESFVGPQKQLPPQYSSKSVSGQRAYDLARQGINVELKEADISIFSIKINSVRRNRVSFDIECSGGTYIRSFVRDFGLRLGVPAYMSYIIRLDCCGFSINDSVSISDIQKNKFAGFTDIRDYAKNLPVFEITPENKERFANGFDFFSNSISGLCLLKCGNTEIGIGEFCNKKLKKVCMFEVDTMKVDEYDKTLHKQKLSLALGYFDSFHQGHISILKTLSKTNGIPSVFTFSEQLSKALSIKTQKDIYSFEDRIALFERYGVKHIFAEKPTSKFLSMSPSEFLDYLLANLRIGTLVCGFDYTFGKDAKGNVDFLGNYCDSHGINLVVVDEKKIGDEKISSSLVKQCLVNGDIAKVNRLLVRDYSILGTVVEGRKQGRLIGFPTVNIKLDSDLVIPKYGVYKGKIRFGGKCYKALVNVGSHPTFNDYSENLEAYVLDFEGDVYGYTAEVFLLDFIRDIRAFECVDELIAQIKKDLEVFDE